MSEPELTIHKDCFYYYGSRPCVFHKIDQVRCEDCPHYKPIESKILIVKLDALGDVLRTTSILEPLHEKYANPAITWVTRKQAVPILENNPLVYKALAVEENYLEYILNEKFDIGICLDPDRLSSTILNLSVADEKYGFLTDENGQVVPASDLSKDWYYMGLDDTLKRQNRRTYFEHVYKICELPEPYFEPQYYFNEKQEGFKKAFVNKKNLSKGLTIGVNTGGGRRWQHKKWTTYGYIELIRILKQKYPQYDILLYGGPEEKDLNREIKNELGDLIVDTGCENSIEEFASLVSLSVIFVTSDSLGMHLSIALNIPTIVLVGPTSPWELDVFGRGKIIYSDLDCIGCYLNTCEKTVHCMNTITPETVLAEIECVMNKS